MCTPKASDFEEIGLEQSQSEGQGLASKHDLTPQSKLGAVPLSKRFIALSIKGNLVTPLQYKNVKGGWERQKRKRLLKTITGNVLRKDEDNVLSASDLENAFANHIAVNGADDTLLAGVTNQASSIAWHDRRYV